MKLSKISLALAAVAVAAYSQAWAPQGGLNAPVEAGKMQASVQLDYMSITSGYDEDGESQDFPNGGFISALGPTIGAQYGIIPNLEAGVFVPLMRIASGDDDADDSEMGLAQPILQAKYGIPNVGLSVYGAVNLPFGSEKIVGEEPLMTYDLGLIYAMNMNQIQIKAGLNYAWIPENDDKEDAGNTITIDLRPGFAVSSALVAELDIAYNMTAVDAYDGEDEDGDGSSLLTVAPGAKFKLNETTAVEALVPISVMGSNELAPWGVSVLATMGF